MDNRINKNNFRTSKKLGQNFLNDPQIVKDIAVSSGACENDIIAEIGPGLGVLTKELLKLKAKVVSIELDDRLIPILSEEFKDIEDFTLINEDALKIDYNSIFKEKKGKVVANIPYYLTTPLILKLIQSNYNIESLTLMIQKEVGDRICAKPSTKEYGSFGILVNYFAKSEILFYVGKEKFRPIPKVDSVVVKLTLLDKPSVFVINEELFFEVIRSSFNMRRKTLNNSLSALKIEKEKINEAFLRANINPSRRGETLSMEEFATLSNEIHNIINVDNK